MIQRKSKKAKKKKWGRNKGKSAGDKRYE